MQHTRTLLTHRHARWQHTHHCHACAANTWRHEHTPMLKEACTRRTWTWCHSLRHGDGFTRTHTHTHNCLCRPTETGNSHTDARSPAHRHAIATHTDTCTEVHANTWNSKHTHTRNLAHWHVNGHTHTHTLSHIGTCTHTQITPQAHKLSSTQACTVGCAITHAAQKTNVTWPLKSAHMHRAANTCG